MYVHQYNLKLALGLTESQAKRMPPQLSCESVVVYGVQVYIVPSHRGPGKVFGHRVRAICPECGVHTSAGRMFQHRKVHGIVPKFQWS